MKNISLFYFIIAILLPAVVSTPAQAVAPEEGINSLQDINPYSNGSYSLGWSFTVNEGVTVTQLGFWDYNAWASLGGTLSESHLVGIFDSQGDLLTSVNVLPTDPVKDLFNWADITPISLYKDQTYYIEAVTGSEQYTYSSQITTAPWMTFLTNNYNSTIPTDQLLFPDSTAGTLYDAAFIGPNFMAIPEPASLALVAIGLAGVAIRRKQLARN